MTEEIRSLNALRGLAALVVLVSHFSGATGWLGEYPSSGAGQLGVMLFFILSGFLMAYLYLHEPLTSGALRRYIVARIARVVPLFAVVIAASTVLPRIGVDGVFYDLSTRAQVISHMLLLSGKSILWTIPTELQFYAVLVIWWAVLRKSPFGILPIVIAAASGLVATRRFSADIGGIPYEFRLPQVIPYFAIGALFGIAYRKWPQLRQRQHRAFASILLLVIALYPKVFEAIVGERHQLWRDPRIFVIMSLIFATVVFLVPSDAAVLANRIGDHLGQISYSLYLLHVPVMWAIAKIALPNSIGFVFFLAASVGVASLSFQLFERPMARAIRGQAQRWAVPESLRSPLR